MSKKEIKKESRQKAHSVKKMEAKKRKNLKKWQSMQITKESRIVVEEVAKQKRE